MRHDYDLAILLDCAKMARSVFYYNRKRSGSADKYAVEREQIRDIFLGHRARYGVRRVCMELRSRGCMLNHKTVARLMREENLKCRVRRRRYRSYNGTVGTVASNIIARDFRSDAPLRKCATDITQININGEKLYLSPVMDMYNGEILSYSISDSPDMALIMEMLEGLYRLGRPLKGMVLHSDQGWHYQYQGYQSSLAEHGIIQSMSRKGNCLDNSMMENFFGLMKNEHLYREKFSSVAEYKKELEMYIEYYNTQRIKLRLGTSPVKYREMHTKS